MKLSFFRKPQFRLQFLMGCPSTISYLYFPNTVIISIDSVWFGYWARVWWVVRNRQRKNILNQTTDTNTFCFLQHIEPIWTKSLNCVFWSGQRRWRSTGRTHKFTTQNGNRFSSFCNPTTTTEHKQPVAEKILSQQNQLSNRMSVVGLMVENNFL